MQGLFLCYAVGKTAEKSKSGKYHYLLIAGEKNNEGMFTSFQPVDFWSEENYELKPNSLYPVVLDVNGDMIRFVKFEGKTNEKEITRV